MKCDQNNRERSLYKNIFITLVSKPSVYTCQIHTCTYSYFDIEEVLTCEGNIFLRKCFNLNYLNSL